MSCNMKGHGNKESKVEDKGEVRSEMFQHCARALAFSTSSPTLYSVPCLLQLAEASFQKRP